MKWIFLIFFAEIISLSRFSWLNWNEIIISALESRCTEVVLTLARKNAIKDRWLNILVIMEVLHGQNGPHSPSVEHN